MILRKAICCTALLAALAQPVPAATACEKGDCRTASRSARPGKPLQLGKFLRPAKTNKHVRSGRAQARHSRIARKPAPAATAEMASPEPASPTMAAVPMPPMAPDAASAFAAQPSDVRVVASDEFNEIDRTARPLVPTTTGSGQHAEPAVKLVDATEYNTLDRKSDDQQVASLDVTSARTETPSESTQPALSWIERLWARLQHTFIALAAAVRYLIG